MSLLATLYTHRAARIGCEWRLSLVSGRDGSRHRAQRGPVGFENAQRQDVLARRSVEEVRRPVVVATGYREAGQVGVREGPGQRRKALKLAFAMTSDRSTDIQARLRPGFNIGVALCLDVDDAAVGVGHEVDLPAVHLPLRVAPWFVPAECWRVIRLWCSASSPRARQQRAHQNQSPPPARSHCARTSPATRFTPPILLPSGICRQSVGSVWPHRESWHRLAPEKIEHIISLVRFSDSVPRAVTSTELAPGWLQSRCSTS